MKNFILQKNDGSKFDLAKYQGNDYLILIFFRGAWCNHCKKQLLDINNHYAEFSELQIKPLAISCDSKLKSNLLKNFLKLKFSVLSDSEFAVIDYFNLKTEYKGQIVSKPATILIEPQKHKVIYEYVGVDYDDRLSAKTILNNIKQPVRSNL